MVQKVNGHAGADVAVSGLTDFWMLSTTVNILPAPNTVTNGVVTVPASTLALDKLVEIISLNGQPTIMGSVVGTVAPFLLYFAIDHTGSWNQTPVNGYTAFQNALNADGIDYGFTSTNTTLTLQNTF